jgi:predicted phosphoribosyltransferase
MDKLRAQLPGEYLPFLNFPNHEERKTGEKNPDQNFRDRLHAADFLLKRLNHFQGKNPLVLGIPRGSVPMAGYLAEKLGGDLDVVLVHKVGAPENPEFAVGSVSEFGDLYRSEAVSLFNLPSGYLEKTAHAEMVRLKNRRATYSPIRAPLSPKNRTVLIVDDGIATGSTMLAAIRAIRAQKPERIVIVSPVASKSALELIQQEADEVLVLEAPEEFFSVSQFYEVFPQVKDEEVIDVLSRHNRKEEIRAKTA